MPLLFPIHGEASAIVMRPEELRAVTAPAVLEFLSTHLESLRPYAQALAQEVQGVLDASGAAQTPERIHAALHQNLPGAIVGFAEPLMLNALQEEAAPPGAHESGMAAVLALLAGIIRTVFEAFGPVNETALTATVNHCQGALLVRLQTMAATIPAAGHA